MRTRVRTLLRWYRAKARDLPWRRTRDPYAIWVSEVMLQQTRAQVVVAYWERWMRALPDVAALASAPEDRVLKLWEGLGYYSRVRNLQAAARMVRARFAGRIPSQFSVLRSLPGVGDYTAGALCSIAFDQPVPVVDGNVARVLTRVWGISGDPHRRRTREILARLATVLVQAAAREPAARHRHCADWNQALMELGAVCCTPRQPDCATCPWRRRCVARRTGRVDDYPNRRRRPQPVRQELWVWLLRHQGRFRLRPHPAGRSRSGYWEFPCSEAPPSSASAAHSGAEPAGRSVRERFRLRHAITRYRYTVHVFAARWTRGLDIPGLPGDGSRWFRPDEIERLPLSGLHRKIWKRQQLTRDGTGHPARSAHTARR